MRAVCSAGGWCCCSWGIVGGSASDGCGCLGGRRFRALARGEFLPAAEEVGGDGFCAEGGGRGCGGYGGVVYGLGHGVGGVEHAAGGDTAAEGGGGVGAGWTVGFLVADRGGEIDFEVRFEDADGAVLGGGGIGFEHGDGVDGVVVGEGEDVVAGQAGEVAEGVFEDGFRVGYVEEGGGLRLQLYEGSGGEVGGFYLEEVAGVEGEGLEHLGGG